MRLPTGRMTHRLPLRQRALFGGYGQKLSIIRVRIVDGLHQSFSFRRG